jgi:hypothetical protein
MCEVTLGMIKFKDSDPNLFLVSYIMKLWWNQKHYKHLEESIQSPYFYSFFFFQNIMMR